MCSSRKKIIVAFACVWASWLIQAGPAFAVQIKAGVDPSRDLWQSMQARKLLQKDPELAAFNVGVSVRDRVAILWGSVPLAELSFKAELCLRTMTELAEIRNQLEVMEEAGTAPRSGARPAAPLFLPEHAPPPLPKIPRLPSLAPAALLGMDTVGKPPAVPTAQPKPRVEKTAPTTQLGAPQLGAPQFGAPQFGLKIEPAPVVVPARGEADTKLEKAVQSLLQSEPSHRQIPVAVREGRVYLRSSGHDSETVQQAARRVAQLPGVAGVVLVEKNSP